ncbi:hypothetical protein LGQ02_07980 [Bacillus shivajii]|nr:hypothetical protein [Bacillus shivajii]UCZ54675.1 hypothetical protein LGQ02_07980 [Bacillus shivajii]
MENKPMHFDGSYQNSEQLINDQSHETVQLTDDMRKNISGNPFLADEMKS